MTHTRTAQRLDPAALDLPELFEGVDYLDVFEVTVASPEERTPDEIWRAALTGLPWPVRRAIRTIHRAVLGFRAVPAGSVDNLIGWRVIEATDDIAHYAADGPLISGTLLLRRMGPSKGQLITGLTFQRRTAGPLVWRAIGPVHRFAAPRLMQRTFGHAEPCEG